MWEMSTNQQSLVQALATIDEGNWPSITVLVPNTIATQTIQLAIPISASIENPILINQTVTNSCEANVSTNAVHSGIACKKLNINTKPLRGNIGGVLLRDVGASHVSGPSTQNRVPVTNNRVYTQSTTSTVIKKPVYAGAANSKADNEMELKKKNELFFRCSVCGSLSRPNVTTCIKCKAPFPPNPKFYTKGAAGEAAVCRVGCVNTMAEPSTKILTQKQFYGKTLQTMGYSFPFKFETNAQTKMKKMPLKRPRNEQPECLTISSDDEGHESKEDKPEEEQETENTTRALGNIDGDIDDNFHITDHPYAESAENNRGTPRPLLAQFKISNVRLTCRSIRVGSHKVGPGNSVEFKGDHVQMIIPTVSNEVELASISIHLMNISVIAHFGKMLPLLAIYTTPSCAVEICSLLKMASDSGPYFDPTSEDETKKRIIILPENLTDENRVAVKILLKNYTGPRWCDQQETLLREIDQKSANDLLLRSTPQELVAQLNKLAVPNKRGRMYAKDKDAGVCFARTPVIFPLAKQPRKAEILKVATYPPPPETGGITITSEDLYCLEPGEFLNDVIIDFYLKYVLLEKLSEEDRNRTHIFSSFFYGRLTHPGMPSQQSIRSPQEAEDHSLPAAERRHSRVKTWTRHVDIFEKDFIIVPINENSHWLLAIICFPYLVGSNSEFDKDSSSNNENEENANDSNAEEPMDTTEQNGDLIAGSDPSSVRIKKEKSTRCEQQNNKKRISKPCILIFDSLHTRSWTKYVVNLREYLRIEWQSKKSSVVKFDKTTLKGSYPIVPQQTNYSDCGVYVLQYVDSFFDNPIMDFTIPIREIGEWFSEETIVKKRDEVKELISKLQREQNECGDSGSNTSEGMEQSGSVSPSDATTELQEALATISDSTGSNSPFNLRR